MSTAFECSRHLVIEAPWLIDKYLQKGMQNALKPAIKKNEIWNKNKNK